MQKTSYLKIMKVKFQTFELNLKFKTAKFSELD